jgi:hypothetical protein
VFSRVHIIRIGENENIRHKLVLSDITDVNEVRNSQIATMNTSRN